MSEHEWDEVLDLAIEYLEFCDMPEDFVAEVSMVDDPAVLLAEFWFNEYSSMQELKDNLVDWTEED